MSEWKSFEIPAKLVGEKRISQSAYVTTYQTEILLPKKSEYSGYHFWYPSKLVSGNFSMANIIYNDTFTFTLVKKDREPGKRYKRYKLTAKELAAVYEPEVTKEKAKQKKKEQTRRAQIGTVEVVECCIGKNKYWVEFIFRFGKITYYGNGMKAEQISADIRKQKVIAESIQRGIFEDAYNDLKSLRDEFKMIPKVRFTVEHTENSSNHIRNSFIELCNRWEEEFYKKAVAILDEHHNDKTCHYDGTPKKMNQEG